MRDNKYAYRATPAGQNGTSEARRLPAKVQCVYVGVDYNDSYTIINTKLTNSISIYQLNQSKADTRCALLFFIIVSILSVLIYKDQK